jgi:L-fuconolactonase
MNCTAAGSSPTDVEPYADHVLEAFGCDRVLWASDWPPLDLASDYSTWKHICDEILGARPHLARQAVERGTAERVYRLAAQQES